MTIKKFVRKNINWLKVYRKIKLVDQFLGATYIRPDELEEYLEDNYNDEETEVLFNEQVNAYVYSIYF